MRQGGSEACARRRLWKRTIPSSSVGFEEKSLTAPERGVKSGLRTALRKSNRPRARSTQKFSEMAERRAFFERRNGRLHAATFFRKCSGVLRALSAQDRSGLNAARLRIGVSGIVSLLKGEAAGLAAVGARSPGFERLARAAGSVGQPLSARLAGSCARAQEKHRSVARRAACCRQNPRQTSAESAGERRREQAKATHGGRASARRSPCLRSAAASNVS